MNSQGITVQTKSGRLFLTLAGDAHFWYESITPLSNAWNNLLRLLHRHFSKLGETGENFFQRWRSFQFDVASDQTDFYVLRLKQCVQV